MTGRVLESNELAGDYAKACHDNIHSRLGKLLGERAVLKLTTTTILPGENKPTAWIIVHRGAAPAKGRVGHHSWFHDGTRIHCKGLGNQNSLNSASHGAGKIAFPKGNCKSKFTGDIKQLHKTKIDHCWRWY